MRDEHPDVERARGFDVILSSDCVYEPASVKPLWRTVDALLSRRADARFVISYEERRCFKDLFGSFHAEAHAAGFVGEEVDIAEFLRVDEFKLQTGVECTPVAPSSGDWATLHLYCFRRRHPDPDPDEP